MEDLRHLLDYLASRLTPLDPSPGSVQTWLDRASTSMRGTQLSACIGIELVTDSIDAAIIASLLSRAESLSADNPSTDAAGLFQLALNEQPHERLLCTGRMPPGFVPADHYVRVLEFTSFLAFYSPIRPISYAQVERGRRQYPDGKPLGHIGVQWRGNLANVWVTREEDLDKVLADGPPGGTGTRVNLRFGFGQPTNTLMGQPEFVAVRYPSGAPGGCVKPTVFDQTWDRNHYYVAHGADRHWGETLALRRGGAGVPEQVHAAINDGLTDEYTLRHLGSSEKNPLIDEVASTAALTRFRDATRGVHSTEGELS